MNLRQRLYSLKSFEELVYIATIGAWSNDETGYPPVSYKTVFGTSGILSSGTESDIWPSSDAMPIPTNAETLSVVSASANDDVGGSGTSSIFIEGLDDDYLPISELVILDGTTPVTSTLLYRHISEINCLNIGSTGTTNAGTITITNSTSGQHLGCVLAGDSISEHGQFLVPAGYNAILLGGSYSVYRSSGSGVRRARVEMTLTPADGGLGSGILYRTIKFGGSSSAGNSPVLFDVPLVVGERILITPKVEAEANSTQASTEYALILVKDTVDIDSVI